MKRILMYIVACATAHVHAAALPQTVGLDDVLRLARDASAAVAIGRTDVDAAVAERRSAGAYPNPTFEYSRSRQPGRLTNFDSNRAHEWTLEQPLLLAGQRQARQDAASQAIEAASARVGQTRHEVAAQAASSWVALLLAQERVALLTDGLDELARLRGVVEGRRAGGLASDYEVLKVDVEEAAWQVRVGDAEADLVERQAALAQAIGVAGWRPGAIGTLAPLPPAAGTHADGRPELHPDVLVARRDEQVAGAQVDVARRERMPNVAVSVGRFWTSTPYGATTSVGVSLELPLFDRRGGALDKAKAQAAAAALERELAEARVRTEVESQARQVAQRRQAFDEFERRSGKRLATLRRMAEDSYRMGKMPVAEMLEAARSTHELALARIDLIAVLMEAQLRLDAARGELLRRAD